MNIVKNEQQRDSANLYLQIFVAVAIVALAGGVVVLVSLRHLDADSFVVGSVFTLLTLLANFCFPNSIGNAKKDDTINKLADKTPPITVPREDLTYGQVTDSGRVTDSIQPLGGISGIDRESSRYWNTASSGAPANPPWEDSLGSKGQSNVQGKSPLDLRDS